MMRHLNLILIPLVVLLLLLLAVWPFARHENATHRQLQRTKVVLASKVVATRLSKTMARYANLLESIAIITSMAPEITKPNFRKICKTVLRDTPGVLTVTLLGRDSVLAGYSTIPGPILHTSLLSGFTRETFIRLRETISQHEVFVTFPQSIQSMGQESIIMVAGMPKKGLNSATMAVITVDPSVVFRQAGLTPHTERLSVVIRARLESDHYSRSFLGDETILGHHPISTDIRFPNITWVLSAIPREGWRPSASVAYIWTVGSGLALLFACGTWFALFCRRRRLIESRRYQHLVDNAKTIILHLDLSGRIAFINEYGQTFFGFQEEELLGQPVTGTLTLDNEDKQASFMTKTVRVPWVQVRFKHEHLRRNGDHAWISWSNRPIMDSRGNATGILCIGTDITELRKSQDELRRNEERYNVMTASTTDIFWGLDTDRRFTYVSPSDQQIRGYASHEVLGKRLDDFVAPGSRKEMLAAFNKVRDLLNKGDRPASMEMLTLELLCKDGTTIWTESAGAAIYSEDGHMVGLQGVARNINDRIRAQSLREDMERIARHDLKTPLAAVIGLPDELIQADNVTDKQKEMLRVIAKAGQSMLELVNKSLNLHKMETGTYQLDPLPVMLPSLVDQVWSQLRPIAAAKGVNFGLDTGAEENQLIVRGDETLLHAMLSNLIKNAVEASPEGEAVSVFMTRTPNEITIQILNKGTVPPNRRETFFEKYETFNNNSSGSGLGTYSARLIARTHGGKIMLDTKTEGLVRITITLPAH